MTAKVIPNVCLYARTGKHMQYAWPNSPHAISCKLRLPNTLAGHSYSFLISGLWIVSCVLKISKHFWTLLPAFCQGNVGKFLAKTECVALSYKTSILTIWQKDWKCSQFGPETARILWKMQERVGLMSNFSLFWYLRLNLLFIWNSEARKRITWVYGD